MYQQCREVNIMTDNKVRIVKINKPDLKTDDHMYTKELEISGLLDQGYKIASSSTIPSDSLLSPWEIIVILQKEE